MKQQLECLIDWLDQTHANSSARVALRALATESLKRSDSPDPGQRRFDAEAIALAADPSRGWSFDSAKRWLTRAEMQVFLDARQEDMFSYFRQRSEAQYLVLSKTDTTGRHRAEWFFELAFLPSDRSEDTTETVGRGWDQPSPTDPHRSEPILVYEYTPPGQIKLSILGRMLLGRDGQVVTYSARGFLWAMLLVSGALLILIIMFFAWAMSFIERPIHTADLIGFFLLAGSSWIVWRSLVRPLVWLVDDRMVPAPEVLTGWSEAPCQLDMAKDTEHRYIRLVRYSGVCPVCAGKIELRYGQGNNARRLFGCCAEVPQEHVFVFDRVTRLGRLYKP
ncbi:hypothetical protein [Hydrogenophaga taeniospiralis]|uniref:hypothetical protein n=1 Tax=Hydrogenophaga taeniospiralis TaxID=65656 RepID=UPI001CF9D225|nr:hypothetical protein [Hydrogenophaga taeniospiralis]UCU95216.1 hypothetical protein KI616_04975 [Hydrogenophaga taeniospiralis]